ncbi:hypothetical protein NHQ30_001121 [Ciborinia camelliae]|nr:hypothetical protein NHQ30_001121 [Ciborinia camelliae]
MSQLKRLSCSTPTPEAATEPNQGLVTLNTKLKDSEILRQNGIIEWVISVIGMIAPYLLNLSIVAIHGICGDREQSWTTKNNTSWLLEQIPDYIPNARVSTFGCNINEEGISAAEIYEKAKGLLDEISPRTLPKNILLIANREKIYSEIARSTSLVVFFGTPHRAQNQAHWESLANNLIYVTNQNNEGALSDILVRSSSALRNVNERYLNLARLYSTVSIYETMKHRSFGKVVCNCPNLLSDLVNEVVLGG